MTKLEHANKTIRTLAVDPKVRDAPPEDPETPSTGPWAKYKDREVGPEAMRIQREVYWYPRGMAFKRKLKRGEQRRRVSNKHLFAKDAK